MQVPSRLAIVIALFFAGQTPTMAAADSFSADGYRSSNNRSITLVSSSDAANTASRRPDTPSGLKASVNSAREVILTWPGHSEQVEGFNIYRNHTYYSTVRDTRFIDRSAAPDTNYTYSLVAFTTDKRFSLRSSSIEVDTSGKNTVVGQDNNAPAASTASTTGASAIPPGYNLVFSDEFKSGSLDPSKWDSKYRWGPNFVVNNESQYYVDQLSNPDFGHQPFQFDGEHLIITAIPTPDYLRSSAAGQPYLSGAMTTYNRFRMRYGYIEMRARLPAGKGLWPAFWMLHQRNDGTRPEIDIVEYIGDQRTTAFHTYHWYENNSWLRSTPTFTAPGPDYSQDFHTYGVRWEPGRITWYIDGIERNSFSGSSVASEDMYILLNLALGGSWAGKPNGSTPFPARMVVDYVRAYQP